LDEAFQRGENQAMHREGSTASKRQIRAHLRSSAPRLGGGLLLAAVIWALVPLPLSAGEGVQVPNEVVINSSTVGKRVQPKVGDICLVCYRPIQDGDAVFLVRGQRVPIHREELEPDLPGQLERLLAHLQPRGAFIGAEQNQPPLSRVWFFLGLYVLVGLIFAALCAHRALHTGHNPFAWFGLGLALNLFAYLLLLTRPRREVPAPAGVPGGLRKIPATYAPQPCAGCGTLNHPSATACLGCGTRLEPKVVSEVGRVGLRPA